MIRPLKTFSSTSEPETAPSPRASLPRSAPHRVEIDPDRILNSKRARPYPSAVLIPGDFRIDLDASILPYMQPGPDPCCRKPSYNVATAMIERLLKWNVPVQDMFFGATGSRGGLRCSRHTNTAFFRSSASITATSRPGSRFRAPVVPGRRSIPP